MYTAGLGPGYMVVHCLNYQLWMGGYTDHATLEATGATVVPFGVGDSEHLIRTIRELGVTAIYCTPSYPAVLEQVIAERFEGLAPVDAGLELALLAGEPGLENPSFRERIETTWGLVARNLYGISDVLTTVAAECAHNTGLHVVTLDALHAELVAPDGDAPIDWAEGATGELVLTHLKRECQPLVRFRTGDIVEVLATEPCACGRTAPRIRVVGRTDDMVVVRGVNVFPGDVAAVVTRFAALSGEFRIRLGGPAPYHRLPVEAELAPGNAATPALSAALAEAIKQATRASAEVTLLAPFELPRSGGKTRRVFREDPS
jgi:phenylacetate-CoA ligase